MAHHLGKHALDRVGMDEGDFVPAQAGPWLRVDHFGAQLDELADGRPDVVHLEGDVMHPRAPLGQESPDRGVGGKRRDELDPALAKTQIDRIDPLRLHAAPDLDLGAKEARIGLDGIIEVLDGHRDVVEPANVHGAGSYPLRPEPPTRWGWWISARRRGAMVVLPE
jgi:hypothetical protein